MHLPPTPSIAGLDVERLDELRDLDPGDTSYLDRAVANFVRNSLEAPAVFREIIAAGDANRLRASAHRLLGSALNLGTVVAVEPLRALESHGDSGTTDGAELLVPAADGALRRGRAQLALYQETYRAMTADPAHSA
ncbi:hypothetical protein ENKNEFLB_02040 [Nocardioides aquaticus]|uniref:HPt domain-containing protein n=1 Tax=Nocardioides aquaticus TaxID=160826 RepID=A0ABX8EHB0_9ACTN|nr:hypothetical protein [Nocardioides aquaticus]QVT79654.1 hypothetical protein ENKNEFLB_02040 [Nocardioides aquaticus]